MSINSLANAAAARHTSFLPQDPPQGIAEIAKAAYTEPTPIDATPAALANAQKGSNSVNTTLNLLFGYIPTEILTLYVAVLAAIQKPGAKTPTAVIQIAGSQAATISTAVTLGEWIAFWSFLVAAPVVVWLVYAAKIKAAGKPLPLSFGALPIWEMFAATVAYFAWAFALPNTPFIQYADKWYSAALAGIVVLIISTILGLLAPLFQRPLSVPVSPPSEEK